MISRAIQDGYITEEGENYRAGSRWRHYASAATPAPYNLGPLYGTMQPVRPVTRARAKTTGIPSAKKRTTAVTSQGLREFRSLIAVACSEERALKIRYRNASGRVTNRVVDILGVGTNHFDAFDHLTDEPRTFRVDRLIKAEWSTYGPGPTKAYSPSKWVRG